MSEVFNDRTPNNGYMQAASQLYEKVDDLFNKRGTPIIDEKTSGMRKLILEDEEYYYANSVFEAEGLGTLDSFEIAEVIEMHDISDPMNIEPGPSTVLITITSGPLEYTYYIGKGDGVNISMFDKDVDKNPDYQKLETAEDLRIALEEGRSFDEPNNMDKFLGSFETENAGMGKLSIEEQHAIESTLDYLLLKD